MRIVGLHVENFGGLCDYSETFDWGLNLRLRPNGWGKSTLAVFIKAMLYGLPATTKRSLIENERKRYSPWNGGAFGGSLDIEVGGEVYRIERFFGAKEAEDRLCVLSLRTGSFADTDWASNPGEGLFGVDSAAYERSTYLSQRPDEMTKDGAVSIHTKLNRLVDATDDLANYDTAMERLEKRRRALHHLTGGGGEIADAQARLSGIERDIERCYAQRAVLQATKERIAKLKADIEGARGEAETIQKSLAQELKRREGRAVGARLEALRAEETELNALLAECRASLGDQEPTETLIETVSAAARAREDAQRRLDQAGLGGNERAEIETLSARFAAGLPTEEQLNALRHAAREYNRATVLATDLSENMAPEEQYPAALAELNAWKEQRAGLGLGNATGKTRRGEPGVIAMIALSLVFAVATIWNIWFGIGAAVCLGGALILIARHSAQRAKAVAQAEEVKQKAVQLDEQIKAAELRLQAAERAEQFAKLWRATFAGEPCPSATEAALCIERLCAQGERLVSLLEKKKQAEVALVAGRQSLAEAEARLADLTRPIKDAPTDTTLLLRRLTEICARYREALVRRARKQAEIASLQAEYRSDDEGATQESVDASALEERQRVLAKETRQWTQDLAREEETATRLALDVDRLDQLEDEREVLNAEIARKQEQLVAIQSAEKYLKLAREQLSSRYLVAMQTSFGRYMAALTGEDAPAFTMDAQFRVKLRAAGAGRDSDAFNTALRDLISLCERLSLVDAMFEGERPFLILDDPFTNLDDATMARAALLLETVADRYQVLYLTCNSSRALQDFEAKEE